MWENATSLSLDDSTELTTTAETELDGSMISPTSTLHNVPTSIIVYNVTGSDLIDASPVTSLYIYELSSSELVTRSFLAGTQGQDSQKNNIHQVYRRGEIRQG
jgi:hypothetical protein